MGKYTNANRKCSTVIDKKTKATCDLYVGDHEWTEPERDANDTDEQHEEKRNAAQASRGKAHRQDLSTCQGYTDDAEREPD